jgi:hypothetical protein
MRLLTRTTLITGLLCALYVAATVQVKADPVGFTINNPVQTVTAGSTITFEATISNPNFDSFHWQAGVYAPGPSGLLQIVDFANSIQPTFFPAVFPGLTTMTGDYLSFALLPNATPGVYTGNIQLSPDFRDGVFHLLQVPVTVTIVSPNEIPEPTSMLLLGSGLLSSAVALRRRRKNKSRSPIG